MEDGIDLIQLFYKLKKRRWLIVYITMACMMISVIASFFIIKPVYQANVNIILGKEEAKYFLEDRYTNNDVTLYLQVAKTYEEIAKSRTVRYRMEENLKDAGFKDIKNIKVASKPGTQILTITVSHTSSKSVAVYANVLAEQFIKVASEVLPAGELKILDRAEQPKVPASPNRMLNIAVSFVVGVVLSVGVILLLEYFNDTIESEQDVVNCLNLPVLCVITQDQMA